MCDDDCIEIFMKLIQPIVIAVLLIVGIPLWVVGGKNKTKQIWSALSSLPLLPGNEQFPIDKFFIAIDGRHSLDFKIPISSSEMKNKDIYIIHNMWGFDIDLTLVTDNEKTITLKKTQNLNLSSPDFRFNRFPIQELPDVGKSLKKYHVSHNTFKVYCQYDTEITKINRINSYCITNIFPMQFDGLYSENKILSSFKSNSFSEITFKFTNSYFIPYTYYDPPEAYILFCGSKFNKAMYYAGVSITSIAIILSVVFIVFDIIFLILVAI
ncbi:hypothetical protein M9Y10_045146 [Tritrichomonas musculus]|uniref:Uncharacterized protein n=1 Tax=Tritrichomonas musculus TaxID=1915356 RepID=A0ABR2JUT5_9EUKA